MELVRNKLSKYYPILILMVSVLAGYVCISYREKDWVTGGLLFQVIVLPILLLEIFMIAGFYLQERRWLKRLFVIIEFFAALCLIAFTIVYIVKYN